MISARFTYDGGHFSDRFVVVGHCCESGDLMTPVPGEPSVLAPRALGGEAQIGDLLVVDGSGACVGGRSSHLGSARRSISASMRAVGFAAESRLNSLGLPRRAARRSDPHALLRRDDRRRHASLQPVRGLSLAGHVAFDARRGDRRHRSSSLANQLRGALRPRVQPHDHQHRAFAARIFRSRVAAAATRIFPKDETRRRRGRDVDISRRRDAAVPRLRKLSLDRARLRRTAT